MCSRRNDALPLKKLQPLKIQPSFSSSTPLQSWANTPDIIQEFLSRCKQQNPHDYSRLEEKGREDSEKKSNQWPRVIGQAEHFTHFDKKSLPFVRLDIGCDQEKLWRNYGVELIFLRHVPSRPVRSTRPGDTDQWPLIVWSQRGRAGTGAVGHSDHAEFTLAPHRRLLSGPAEVINSGQRRAHEGHKTQNGSFWPHKE